VPLEPSDELIRAVDEALQEGDVAGAARLTLSLHVADQADLLEQLGREGRAELVGEIKPQFDPELLTYLDEHVRAEVIELLGPTDAAAAIARLDTDDAIEVLEDRDEAEQIALLETLPLPERTAVEEGLNYPEDSAGRLMQRDFVAAPEFWTVGQTIDYLRANRNLPDDFYDIYIINPRFEPVGSSSSCCSLRLAFTVAGSTPANRPRQPCGPMGGSSFSARTIPPGPSSASKSPIPRRPAPAVSWAAG
jgi:magnesium transporter